MQVPHFVRRATWRVVAGVAATAALVAVIGLAGDLLLRAATRPFTRWADA